MVEFLTLTDVLETHREQIETYGGTDGLRDWGLLESALAQPEAEFEGELLHYDVFEMAAAYLFHLVQNHPFTDGNKRVGLETSLLFLAINGYRIEADDEKLFELVMSAAQGNADKPMLAAYYRKHAVVMMPVAIAD